MRIKNLTNSPYTLINAEGKPVPLPARGEVDIEPHPMHASHYRQVGYFEIKESSSGSKSAPKPAEQDPIDALRADYLDLAGKPADKRWSEARLQSEIEGLMENS